MHFQANSLKSENSVRDPQKALNNYAPVTISIVRIHLFPSELLTCRACLCCVRVVVFGGRTGGPEELAEVWQETFLNIHTAMYEAYG